MVIKPLFSDPPEDPKEEADRQFTTGLLPSQFLREAVTHTREVRSAEPVGDEQFQPASLDLRLGNVAYRVRASFLPGPDHTVQEKIKALSMHTVDLAEGAVLERDCIYIVPLIEHLALRYRTTAFANPKSSTGRLNIFARVITDYGTEFDHIKTGYNGPLYVELSPRAFSVVVRKNSRLVQLRIRKGSPPPSNAELRRLHAGAGFLDVPKGVEVAPELLEDGLKISVDVANKKKSGMIGYRAKRHTGLIDVDKVNYYNTDDFWEPVTARRDGGLILDPNEFYILASAESIVVPVNWAAEMLAYDTLVGEFRVHYAGFFDPGFGADEAGGQGSRAVLEVRSHEVPFLIEHGQTVGRLVYERLMARPDRLYGGGIGSNYQRQGLALSKHFKKVPLR
jgi:dCTP deaminase